MHLFMSKIDRLANTLKFLFWLMNDLPRESIGYGCKT